MLKGFEETNIITFGGMLPEVKPVAGTTVLLTLVPEFPSFPPENSWMRVPRTEIPGLVIREQNGARIAYLPADIDRRYEHGNIPDHGDLLANLVRWAAKDSLPLVVQGPGLIDCHLYRQQNRLVLHLVNLTSAHRLLLSVSGATATPVLRQGRWAQFEVKSILDHEIAVLD